VFRKSCLVWAPISMLRRIRSAHCTAAAIILCGLSSTLCLFDPAMIFSRGRIHGIAPVKRTMSAAARRKIAAFQRARWAKLRAPQKKAA
jgi:hypothetical protein